MDWQRVSRPDFIRPGTRVINNLQLGQALTGELKLDPPVMGLYVYNTNPVSQAPQTNKIVKGLSREDLFFVTAEHFDHRIVLAQLLHTVGNGEAPSLLIP